MPLRRHLEAFEEEVRVLATLDIGGMWDRLLGEFLDRWGTLQRQGLPAAEVEREMAAFMASLSDRAEADLARTSSSVVYNEGRQAELLTAGINGALTFVVRSEVLDSATCEACETLDGAVFEIGTADFEANMPPAHCFGGDRCRGFYVPIPG